MRSESPGFEKLGAECVVNRPFIVQPRVKHQEPRIKNQEPSTMPYGVCNSRVSLEQKIPSDQGRFTGGGDGPTLRNGQR